MVQINSYLKITCNISSVMGAIYLMIEAKKKDPGGPIM